MLSEWYPNPKVVKQVFGRVPTVHTPNSTWKNSHPSPLEKANKLGLEVAEYWDRCNKVKKAFADYQLKGLHTGDKVYPHTWDLWVEHGQCEIIGVCWDYDLYGDVEWHDPPFIMQIRNSSGKIINCTVGYVQRNCPEKGNISC